MKTYLASSQARVNIDVIAVAKRVAFCAAADVHNNRRRSVAGYDTAFRSALISPNHDSMSVSS